MCHPVTKATVVGSTAQQICRSLVRVVTIPVSAPPTVRLDGVYSFGSRTWVATTPRITLTLTRLRAAELTKLWKSRSSIGFGPVERRLKVPNGENPAGSSETSKPPPGSEYAGRGITAWTVVEFVVLGTPPARVFVEVVPESHATKATKTRGPRTQRISRVRSRPSSDEPATMFRSSRMDRQAVPSLQRPSRTLASAVGMTVVAVYGAGPGCSSFSISTSPQPSQALRRAVGLRSQVPNGPLRAGMRVVYMFRRQPKR
jgi:hypothetical protein